MYKRQGINRLKIRNYHEKIDTNIIIPSPGQGVIAIVVREDDSDQIFLKKINHQVSYLESECERIYLSALDGSCKTPIGALAKLEKESNKKKILFKYMASTINGNKYIKDQTYFDIEDYRKMSFNLGKKIKKQLLHSEDSPYTTNK